MKRVTLFNTLRGIGVAISLYVIFVWLFYILNIPSYMLLQPIEERQSISGKLPFPLIMIVISVITAWASIKAQPRVLIIFSLLSLFPGGYYFLGANNWYRATGILSLVLVYVSFWLAAVSKNKPMR